MDTKRELLEATLLLIARRGYENVRIDDIAAATNNTKGAVYHYFSSKQDLYVAALRHLSEHATALASVTVDGETALAESIKRRLTDIVDNDPTDGTDLSSADMYYLFFDGMRRFPDLRGHFQDLGRSYLRSVTERITEGSDDDRRIDALQLLVWVEGLSLIQAVTGGLIDKREIGAMVDRFFA